MCISMPPCIASGFYIVANSEKKQADNGKTYSYSVLASISLSNTSAVDSFLKTLTRSAQIYVTATGNKDSSGDIVLSKISDAYVGTGAGAAVRFSPAHILRYLIMLLAAHYVTYRLQSIQ